ncbi:MAG: polysaccharide deacetylase family protein, partial [Phycisphaerales bacterium]
MEVIGQNGCSNAFSCELEDWFHILGSDRAPRIEEWAGLPLRAEKNIEQLLELLAENNAQATFFCLGWMAERLPHVVRRCRQAGHEIGSHGYGHVLAYEVGPEA